MAAEAFLTVRNLSKSYGEDRILRDVSFEVERGETMVICGPSGCGKSTLLRCLNGLEPVETGTLRIGEREIDLSNARVRETARDGTGLVFQNFNLFPHMTVLQNLTLAPKRVRKMSNAEATRQADELLELVGLTERRAAYPFELSGGQRQRVAIARALAMKPDLLMFDEPTSALDPEKKEEVLGVIGDLKQQGNVTMIVVTHEIGFGKNVADWAMLLEEGRIVEHDRAQSFFTAPKSPRTQQFLKAIINA
ncbi:amino acid ABC transporter ATP-binding protein [Oceanibacterium hippocampi]|uniref:Arginine transport ATP-binding protein ArtM n=1 Tax=Oceanibacterium hippocampi TaxID=745714 RepID=A0A1Y5U244_9PROT|nr:amino acid ABC transporter ATP-binding protein [Oceanibacterium hippocampi]SLN75290.1 Arginine transport ATP-binding protein ArtM [Oceanibacterium hippocampi]